MNDGPHSVFPRLFEGLLRHSYGRMVAGLVRILGPARIDLAEDILQDAMMRAVRLWPGRGVPDEPEAWLQRVAQRLAIDSLRREAMEARHLAEIEQWAERLQREDTGGDEIQDDQLRMIFTCCHPDLQAGPRVALTLKTLCGLGVAEIAAALLLKESTVSQRLTRAKARLQRADVVFEVPGASVFPERLSSVLEVIYLLFNEGYRAHAGDALVRRELVLEALRLADLLLQMPKTCLPKVHALVALMLFLGSRLEARIDTDGVAVPLAQQDRSLWNHHWIRCAWRHFDACIDGSEITPYHVEAAIASCHVTATSDREVDWVTILERYDQLMVLLGNPVVRLNRAVAVAKVRGPAEALLELETLRNVPVLVSYHLLWATRAHVLWMLDRREDAIAAYDEALQKSPLEPERRLLERRRDACQKGGPPPPL